MIMGWGARKMSQTAVQPDPVEAQPAADANPATNPVPAAGQPSTQTGAVPPGRFAFFGRWAGWLAGVWPKASPWILGIVVLLFIVFQIEPWKKADAGMNGDLAAGWSQSIKQLGIEPLFPPQEDFHVGDVWAVIATYAENPGEPRELNPSESIVGKGVRIGRIELAKLGYSNGGRPVFPVTKVGADGKIIFDNTIQAEPAANPKNGIELSYVSFPSFVISSHSSDSGSISSLLGLSASRGVDNTETIKIPIAETYSAPAANAVVALTNWCGAPENMGMCTDETMRSIVAYSLQNKVYEVLDSKYRYGLELKLVIQTFMTRKIDFDRSSDATLALGLGGMKAPETPTVGTPPPAAGVPVAAAEIPASDGLGRSDNASLKFGIESVIYPRPMVFGFRAVSVALDASLPKKR